jgi:acetyltransferase-like isoleucine patch superfamily enzyme
VGTIILEKLNNDIETPLLNFRNRLRIKDCNNQIILNDKNRIRYCDISLRGKNNKLIFKNGANLKDVSIEVDGGHCLIEIGMNCVIAEACYISARGQRFE